MQQNTSIYRNKIIKADEDLKIISTKEYLGDRSVEIFEAGSNIDSVGDYAFFGCKNLRKVSFSNADVCFGKDVFSGCDKLIEVSIGECDNSYIMATSLKLLCGDWILNKRGDLWYEAFDEELIKYIKEDNMKGFEGLWTFGEEDYSERKFDEDIYVYEKIMDKCNLTLMRLIYNNKLSDENKTIFVDFISKYKLSQTIDAIITYHKGDVLFYKCIMDNVVYNSEERLNLLEKASEEGPEIRAVILSDRNNEQEEDAFSKLLSGI